jgi:hypothetical protein
MLTRREHSTQNSDGTFPRRIVLVLPRGTLWVRAWQTVRMLVRQFDEGSPELYEGLS